ncbi:MAG: hypothetical protein IJ968_08165 [Clostridia bacterium]|nr:hypothetical protein [Clostridia bacterium]
MKNAVIYPQEMPMFMPELYRAYDAGDANALVFLSRQVDKMQLMLFEKARLLRHPAS